MNRDCLRLMIDLFVEDELPEELEGVLMSEARRDLAVADDLETLSTAVAALRDLPVEPLSEESSQRILLTMMMRGVDIASQPDPGDQLQYQLPLPG